MSPGFNFSVFAGGWDWSPDGTEIIHDGVSGMSGGEGQELIAFILGAALRYRLGEGGESLPVYGSVILDEGFVKADCDFTGRALGALQALGFQLIIGAPGPQQQPPIRTQASAHLSRV